MKTYDGNNPKPDSKALRSLAKRLATQPPPPAFNWAQWHADDATEHSCGSFGCVAGWAATFFPKRLRFAPIGSQPSSGDRAIVCVDRTNREAIFTEPIDEFARAFGLTFDESSAITTGSSLFREGPFPRMLVPYIEIHRSVNNKQGIAAKRVLKVLGHAEKRYARQKKGQS